MIVHERQKRILDLLQQHPTSSVELLQQQLGVSRSTLRRDLLELEELGAIIRVHGGVVHRDTLRGEPTYDRRGREQTAAKRGIAQAVVELIPRDCVVYLDAGTTCAEVGRQLAARTDLKIFTHSIRLLIELGDAAASLTCIGGEYRAVSQAVVGGLSLAWLRHLRCDIAILGASGLDCTGASTTELSEAALKQEVLQRSQYGVIVADARKWEKPAAVNFAEWNSIRTLATDVPPDSSAVTALEKAGTDILLPGNRDPFPREGSV